MAKRVIATMMTLWLLLVCTPVSAQQTSGSCGKNITWTLSADGTLTLTGTGAMPDYAYNSSYTGITSPWNKQGLIENVRAIVVGEGITALGEYAFKDCENAAAITLPSTLETIRYGAFEYCESLQEITIPQGVTAILDSAFFDCNQLTRVELPQGLKKIGSSAFFWCKSLETIDLPDSITSLGTSVFSFCDALKSIRIPAGVSVVPMNFCAGCTSLEQVTIPEGVTTIESYAFDKAAIDGVMLPASLKNLGTGAFRECSQLEAFGVNPSNRQYMASDGVLYSVDKQTLVAYPAGRPDTDFVVPDHVTNLGNGAFQGAAYLETVTIPCGVTAIGASAFSGSAALQKVLFEDAENSQLKTVGGFAFFQCKSLTDAWLPDSVTDIDADAFYGCSSFTADKIHIPASLTHMGGTVFGGTPALKNMAYVNNMKQIRGWLLEYRYDSFFGSKVTVPDGIIGIAAHVFAEQPELTAVHIPASVRYIGEEQFTPDYDGNTSLTTITVDSANAWYTATDGVLYNKDKTSLLCYPGAKADAAFAVPDTVKTIDEYAFYYNQLLTEVTLPEGLEVIASSAFSNCKKLQSPQFPSTLTTIEWSAFASCEAMKTLSLPDHLESVNCYAFNGTGYSMADENWENGCLVNNGWLLQVWMEEPTEQIQLARGIEHLADYVFSGCGDDDIQAVILPDTLRSIGRQAFVSLNALTDVYFEGSADDWNKVQVDEENDALFSAELHFVQCTPGDVNGDGEVTAVDAWLALQAATRARTLWGDKQVAADVDGVMGVSAVDALMILQRAAGTLTALPAA